MSKLNKYLEKAAGSPFWRFVFNRIMWKKVPFNGPHGFALRSFNPNRITVRIPFKKQNKNHIGSIHACAMATAAEYASGLLLTYHMGASKYRIIMQHIEADYHYQGRQEAFAEFLFPDEHITEVKKHLEKDGLLVLPCEIKVIDTKGNLLAVVKTVWQLKDWKLVRLK